MIKISCSSKPGDKTVHYIMVGVAIFVAVVLLAFFGYKAYKYFKGKKKNVNKEEEQTLGGKEFKYDGPGSIASQFKSKLKQ